MPSTAVLTFIQFFSHFPSVFWFCTSQLCNSFKCLGYCDLKWGGCDLDKRTTHWRVLHRAVATVSVTLFFDLDLAFFGMRREGTFPNPGTDQPILGRRINAVEWKSPTWFAAADTCHDIFCREEGRLCWKTSQSFMGAAMRVCLTEACVDTMRKALYDFQ